MASSDDAFDVAFIEVAIRQGSLTSELAARVLAFARLKRKPVSAVATDLGVMKASRIEKTSKLARYRVARAEDRLYAEVAVRTKLLTRAEALEALARQRDLFRAKKGFIRFLALLRETRRISREDERRLRERASEISEGTRARVAAGASATLQDDEPVAPARPEAGSTYQRVKAALA